jgi:hypothetical protein
MAFSGDLTDFPLPELMFFLSGKRHSGWLSLRRGPTEITFTLVRGQPVAARSSAADQRLGARLVADGLITRTQLELALARQLLRDPTPALGALLVELECLPSDVVRQAVHAQLRALLMQVLGDASGSFCFTRGLPDVLGVDLDLNLEREVLAAIGRVDEQFAAQLPTARLRLVSEITPERLVGAVGEDWPLFEALLDGATSLAELIAGSGWPAQEVTGGVARLHAQGVVRVEPRSAELSGDAARAAPQPAGARTALRTMTTQIDTSQGGTRVGVALDSPWTPS